MTVQEWLGEDNKIGIDIWERKYRHNDESFDDWIERVSGGNKELGNLIREKKFLFGGRILANRGLYKQGVKVTYSNCYVLSSPDDSIESIFECASKLARTFSFGGGVGIDISRLAPRGAKVNNTAKETSGAVSFMDLYSLVTGLIGQNGRRGALMLSLDCSHPDLEEFIGVKSDLDRITKANISVRVNNDFMKAVENDKEYELSFIRTETNEHITKKINAKSVFRKLAEMNWNYAEPGILFWDNITEYNLNSKDEEFELAGTNPCAEEPLPAGGSCLLGSINLASFVRNKEFDFEDFKNAVSFSIIALDEVLDEGLPLHPLQEQRDCVRDWRQIGLGILGLADALINMGIEYGSNESKNICAKIAKVMADTAIKQSALLAKEKGMYPKFKLDKILESEYFIYNASKETIELVKEYGLRNSQLLTIAPTGSLSTMIGVSGGIEPIFANYYTRKTESLHGKDVYYKVYTPIVDRFIRQNNLKDDSELPNYFVTAQTLNYKSRIEMQSVWQKSIDASISSTVNVPELFTIEETEDLYKYAWKCGLKGVTIYRDNCKRSGVLTLKEEEKEQKYDFIEPISRKKMGTTHGSTYCKKCACGTLYITVNRDEEGHIVECFVHTSKGGICQANISAINRMASLCMRSGVKIDEIIDQLKSINCPACVKVKTKGEHLDGMSCPDIMARVINEFKNSTLLAQKSVPVKEEDVENDSNKKCPDCGEEIVNEGGCVVCKSCGYSKCG